MRPETTYVLRVWRTRSDMEAGAAPVAHLKGYPRRDTAFMQGIKCLAGCNATLRSGEAKEVQEEHPYRIPRVWRFLRLP